MLVLYYGCADQDNLGHFLWRPWQPGYMRSYAGWEVKEACPWKDHEMDGGLQPRGGQGQIEGPARLHHQAGWTAIAWWDRTADPRGNSCSVVVAHQANLTFDQMVEAFRENFPVVWERVTARIKLRPEGT